MTPTVAVNNHVQLGRSPSTDADDDDRACLLDEAASVNDIVTHRWLHVTNGRGQGPSYF